MTEPVKSFSFQHCYSYYASGNFHIYLIYDKIECAIIEVLGNHQEFGKQRGSSIILHSLGVLVGS